MPLPVLDVPTYQTKLPSTSKAVVYRPFLVKEHKILLMLKDADNQEIHRVLTEVIDNCTFKKLNVKDLAFFDLVHLFLELRKVSIGEFMDLVINCECGAKIDTRVNLNDVKVITAKKIENRIKIHNNVAIELRYPHLLESLEAYTTTNVENVMDLLCDCIVGVHDLANDEFHSARDLTKQEILEYLENLNSGQLQKLVNFFENMPKVSLAVVADCPSCKKHHDLKLEGLDNFFV